MQKNKGRENFKYINKVLIGETTINGNLNFRNLDYYLYIKYVPITSVEVETCF